MPQLEHRSWAIQRVSRIFGPMRVFATALLVLVALGVAIPAHADAMRCRNRLVREGDTRAAVRDLCGQPSDVQTRTILRRPYYDYNGRLAYYGDGLVEIPVEVWTYNLGPYKLMRRIRFVDGIIDDIETLGYGYHADAAADTDNRDRRDTYR
jgi:hypothetical protein